MKLVPRSWLRSVYAPGSLTYIQNGFEFTLRNRSRPLTLERVSPIEIDGEPWPVDGVSFATKDEAVQAADISRDRPWTVPRGSVTVKVQGRVINHERHSFKLPVTARALGDLEISFSDKITSDSAAPSSRKSGNER